MKICYFGLGFPPALALGGPILNSYELTRRLVSKGHSVTVCCTNLATKNKRLFNGTRRDRIEGVEVVYLQTYKVMPLGMNSFGLYISPELVDFCKTNIRQFDVVHVDGFRDMPTLVAAHFCRKDHVPFVNQSRNSILPTRNSIFAKRCYDLLFKSRIVDTCALFIASTPTEVEEYRKFLGSPDRIICIPNGIDVSSFAHLPPRQLFRDRYRISEPYVITYLGRLHPIKGIDVLLRAYAASTIRQQARVMIVGPDEDYKNSLISLANELGILDNITFTGALMGEDKLAAYVGSDVVVYAAKAESFGMVAAEAIMCGVPVITAKETGCGDLLRHLGLDLLTPYGDHQHLAELLAWVSSNKAGLTEPLQRARAALVHDYDWDKIVDQYVCAYEQVSRGGALVRDPRQEVDSVKKVAG